MQAITDAIGDEVLIKTGKGIVLDSRAFPVPFVLTPNGGNMNVNVGAGQAHDNEGLLATMPIANNALLISDPSNPRKSLIVIRHKYTGSVPVPKPSDPILTVFLNLIDDFELLVRSGIPSGAPVYPAPAVGDIVIAGYSIPAAATNSSACTVDYTQGQYGAIGDGQFDAITGLSDASLAAALTRLGATKKKILCAVNEALASTINVSNDDTTVCFKPGVTFSDGGAGTGLNITGKRARIESGRFSGFTVTALNYAAAAKYGVVLASIFNTCTDEVTDATGGTVQVVAPITE